MRDGPTQAPLKAGKSLRILVVEDHADTLRAFWPACSIISAIERGLPIPRRVLLQFLQSNSFDVILSDIVLPDGSGYDIVSQAKQKQAVKAVALSGFDGEEDIRRGKEAGFDFHLSKPVDFHELRTILDQVSA
jgi:CheY-like chemotaxis protein